jgi:hypothetical protein
MNEHEGGHSQLGSIESRMAPHRDSLKEGSRKSPVYRKI